jgi:hypothetical protein
MKSGFFALGLAVGFPMFADAQEHDGSYYCVAEFSAGLIYREALKKWESTRFRPNDKFVVRFKYAGPHPGEYGGESYSDDYFVTVTLSGSDKTEACKTNFWKGSDRIEFTRDDAKRGDCETISAQYTFSLTRRRFQTIFQNWNGLQK